MIKIKSHLDFERLLKALSDDVIDAHIHFRMHADLVESTNKDPIVFQQSSFFWGLTIQAHLNSCLYALFRAYDQEKTSLHLRSWLITIQANMQLFEDAAFRERLKDNPYVASLAEGAQKPDFAVLAKDIASCSANDPIVKKMTIYRSSRIAHSSAKKLIVKLGHDENNALTFDDLKELLGRAKSILNRYSYLFAASVYSTEVVGNDDYKYIFKSVVEKVELDQRK